MYSLVKKILFALDAEDAHNLAASFIPLAGKIFPAPKPSPLLRQEVWQKEFSSPVGLAAGFDKSGKLFSHLQAFGFSFVESGTFTPQAQIGNPRPRIFRIPEKQALFNRMGFNNPGIERGIINLSRKKSFVSLPRLGISLGKAKTTLLENALRDYLFQIDKIKSSPLRENLCYVAVNISSPNTPGLRQLQNKQYLQELLTQLVKESPCPLVVKFAPDFGSQSEMKNMLETALRSHVQGIILTNTSSQSLLLGANYKHITAGGGGLSGEPLRALSLQALGLAQEVVQDSIPIISSGGVMSAEDVWQRLQEGAALVQIYSGFIYQGPGFVRKIHSYLDAQMKREGFASLKQMQQEFWRKKKKKKSSTK